MTEAELRDLDAQIHREVVGLHCEYGFSHTYEESEQDGKDWWNTFDGEPSSVQNRWSRVPNYTSDISACWVLAEEMKSKEFDLALESVQPFREGARWSALFTLANGHDTGQFWESSAPLAICLAALAAVRTKQ